MTMTFTAPLAAGATDPQAAPTARPALVERQVDTDTSMPDIVDVWGHGSFPASDAPANW